jgi:hypothetical protein
MYYVVLCRIWLQIDAKVNNTTLLYYNNHKAQIKRK